MTPYFDHAVQQHSARYSALPLPFGMKSPPPEGWTGADAPMASRADVETWRECEPGANIAARLPDDVLAIDVDDYDGKQGAATFAKAVAELGPLPASPFVTSRGVDSPSRKILFRVPPGSRFVANLGRRFGPDVDVLQHGHRYVLSAGSIHPDGEMVRAFRADGTPLPNGCMPHPKYLAELPASWLAALRPGERPAPSSPVLSAVYDALPENERRRLDKYVDGALRGLADDLRAIGSWPVSQRDDQGDGWEKLCANAAWELGKLARASWNVLTLEEAEEVYLASAPTDKTWTAAKVRGKWLAQCHRGDPRDYPATPRDLAAEWAAEPGIRVDPDLLATPAAPHPVGEGPQEKDGPRGPSVSTQLVRLAEAGYTFGQSLEGEPFALPKRGARVPRMLRGGSGSLRAELAEAQYRVTGKAPSQSALTDALGVLDGLASHAAPVPLALRLAETEGALWLDIGDASGRAIRVEPGVGWSLREASSVLFRRTPLTSALPEPERGGSLSELWDLLNVSEADRPVVAAVLVAALLPDIPHPVVIVDGEQGSGKTSACRFLGSLLDPSPVPLRKPPSSLDTWTTAAAGSWVVAVDNVSTLQPWFGDALCRASTGDGDVQRRLYTNGELYVVSFRRVVILNGIDLAGIRDDLADRAVTVHLDRLSGRYRDDAEIARAWTAAHPRVLGALLDLAVKVLAARGSVVLEDPPRMVDFARVLAAVDLVLGTDGMARYRTLSADLAADAVTGDPVLAAIVEAIQQPWTGTAAELRDLLSRDFIVFDRYPPRDWPADARAMSGVLRRRAPSLRRLGWTVEDLRRGGKDKQLRWTLVPPPEAGMAGITVPAPPAGMAGMDAPAPLAGISTGMAGINARSAGISNGDARHRKGPLTCDDTPETPFGGQHGHQDHHLSPLTVWGEERESGEVVAVGEGGSPMPVLPAMPAAWTPDWSAVP